tara:strand:- start:4170 stop:5300 length:1131 start_codon:yes stop_codon:yes gene_type:complete
MRTQQNVYIDGKWAKSIETMDSAELVLLFGNRNYAKDSNLMSEIKAHFPAAQIVGCTTAGEVAGTKIYDESLCLTAIDLAHSSLAVVSSNITHSSTQAVAEKLAKQLEHKGLRYAIVLSDGHQINGTELVNGLQEHLPDNVLISGGLAGDGTQFSETIVWHNDNLDTGNILVIGFYGEKLSFGHGCIGGWNAFGPDRTITKSQSNILYELDGKPALELYKKYLGPHAEQLPSSALLFPLVLKIGDNLITRTILNINEADGSMIFAGDVPEGATVQLMRANAGNLIDGAELAAVEALDNLKSTSKTGLALLISCVGRRLVLDKYTEEELEVVKDIIGEDWTYAGFYSYGELSPMVNSNICALHNQTMTITTLCETDE